MAAITTAQFDAMREAAQSGRAVDEQSALAILHSHADQLPEILAAATAARRRRFGRRVALVGLISLDADFSENV